MGIAGHTRPVMNPDHVLLQMMLVLEAFAAEDTRVAPLDAALVTLVMLQRAARLVHLHAAVANEAAAVAAVIWNRKQDRCTSVARGY